MASETGADLRQSPRRRQALAAGRVVVEETAECVAVAQAPQVARTEQAADLAALPMPTETEESLLFAHGSTREFVIWRGRKAWFLSLAWYQICECGENPRY